VSTIAAFHSHASPSRALPLASSIGAARRYHHHHASACCFAAKPTTSPAVAAELLDQDGAGPSAASTQEAAKPRKKRRSRKAKKSAAAASLEADKEGDGAAGKPAAAEEKKSKEGGAAEDSARALVAGLDDVIVNPVGLGRRSRQMFDEVWRKFSRLAQMSSASSTALAEEEQAVLVRGGPMCEFTVPGAQDTTVLVVGATSRIGRIVVRKLMLRGYNVKEICVSIY